MSPRERQARRRSKTHAVPVILGSVFGFLLICGIAFGVGMMVNVNRWLSDLPDYTDIDNYMTSEPTSIVDMNGNEIASLYVQNRDSVEFDQISPYVIKGTVDVEDERFYAHPGVDIIGIGRAVLNQLAGRSEGASTITQQLVRNTILSEEQFDNTIERKVREAWIALQMEKIFSKDEILTMYLNTIYYGHGAYGIQAASVTYFSKNASDLTLAEAALLIGLPNAPGYYDPTTNPDLALSRRNKVLGNMLRQGTITQEEHDAAVAEPITLNLTEQTVNGTYAHPYFVDYVKTLLQEEFSTDVLFKGGLTVKTTIDPNLQALAEDAAISRMDAVDSDGELNVGMTVIDPKTGYIKAMVGGRNYDADDSHINHATSRRSTGSAFKAITLAAAIDAGMSPALPINCSSPMTIDPYYPADGQLRNYGNYDYGTLTLAQATAKSSNTGYVQVALAIGNDKIIDMSKKLGIDTDAAGMDPYAASLTLTGGGYGCSTVEMAEAFATYAAGGKHRNAVAISEILNREGEILYQHEDDPTEVLTAGEAAAVTDCLEQVMTGGGTGASGRPSINQPIAGKTGTGGTANDTTDLWFCGYTPQLSVAIWVGRSLTNDAIPYLHTADTVLPIFRTFMNSALEGVAREEFATGTAPTYKKNSEWKLAGGSTSVEKAESPESPETEAATGPATENGTTGGTTTGGTTTGGTTTGGNGGANTPTQPSTPTPEPEPDPEPEPEPEPETPAPSPSPPPTA